MGGDIMHITIKDQEGEGHAIMCVERGAAHGQVLTSTPELLPTMERIAKAMGVDYLRMEVLDGEERPPGWEPTNLVVIAKEMNG